MISRKNTSTNQNMRHERATTLLQSWVRAKSKRYQLGRWKRAAIIIQRAVKTKEKRITLNAKLAVAVEEALMDSKLLGLKEKVALASGAVSGSQLAASPTSVKGRQVNDELLGDIEKYVLMCEVVGVLHNFHVTNNSFA